MRTSTTSVPEIEPPQLLCSLGMTKMGKEVSYVTAMSMLSNAFLHFSLAPQTTSD